MSRSESGVHKCTLIHITKTKEKHLSILQPLYIVICCGSSSKVGSTSSVVELKQVPTQCGPIGLPFFFNPPDSLSPLIASPPLPYRPMLNERSVLPPSITPHVQPLPPLNHLSPPPLQCQDVNDVVSLATTTTSGARAPHSWLL
jgi:hypothetical protein